MALRITQVRSAIGTKPEHHGTLRALGLGRPGRRTIRSDSAEVRGMLRKVAFLVQVEVVDGD